MEIKVGDKFKSTEDDSYFCGDQQVSVTYAGNGIVDFEILNEVGGYARRTLKEFNKCFIRCKEPTKEPKHAKIIEPITILSADLKFVEEAKKHIVQHPDCHTYRNEENNYIALNMGNGIDVYRTVSVAYFEND